MATPFVIRNKQGQYLRVKGKPFESVKWLPLPAGASTWSSDFNAKRAGTKLEERKMLKQGEWYAVPTTPSESRQVPKKPRRAAPKRKRRGVKNAPVEVRLHLDNMNDVERLRFTASALELLQDLAKDEGFTVRDVEWK